uniref:Helicase ATP-binding domain-containing protein n=1 Tax=Dictyoglomus turgidum TaxID=513050 RepID=A0A7C3SNC5_9BACT
MTDERMEVIYSDWLYIPRGRLYEPTIKAALTFFPKKQRGWTEPIQAYREEGDYLLVPREFYRGNNLFVYKKILPEWEKVEFQNKIELRDDIQRECAEAMEKNDGGIISLACGLGKTVLALNHIAKRGYPAIVIVNTTALLQQWAGEIKRFLNIRPGVIQGGDPLTWSWQEPVVLAMLHTLSLNAEEVPYKVRSRFGTVVFDECLDSDTIIWAKDGFKRLGDIVEGDMVMNPFGEFNKVKKVWKVKKEAIQVITMNGSFLIGSRDHIVMGDMGEQKLEEVAALFSVEVDGIVRRPVFARIPVGERELIDIEVDSPDGLFIANGFIVHNCHHVSAPFFSRAAPLFWGQRWGLSATPERADGTHPLFIAHLGPVIYKYIQQPLVPEVIFVNAKVSKQWKEIIMDVVDRTGEINLSRIWTLLSEDPIFLDHCFEVIKGQLLEKRKVLVLSKRLETLYKMFEMSKRLNIPAGLITGRDNKSNRIALLRKSVLTFGTTKLAQEGLDDPYLDTLIMIEPVKDQNIVQQSIGRILRDVPKKPPRYIMMLPPYGPCWGMINNVKKVLRQWKISFRSE